nr:reverse transcriptase domain-containing protein [Tanacetum cinerariifolium]
GISILLAVGTPSTGSGKLYCQWELSYSSGNALCILFPTLRKFERKYSVLTILCGALLDGGKCGTLVISAAYFVKEKPEKDKIGTKSDKNGKRGKTRQCRRPITVKKAKKRRKYKVQRTKDANPRSCITFKTKTRDVSAIIYSSKLSRDQTSNPTSSMNTTPKGRTRRSSKQKVKNSNFEEHLPPVATMADNCTMAEMLRAPIEWCAEAIVVPPILAEPRFLECCCKWQFVGKSPQDALTIIENKSKVRNSQSKLIASQVKACDINSNSEIAKLTHVVNQQTSDVTTAMTAMLEQLQATPPPAPVKAVEETCVTCGAACNYNQGNPDYRPQGVANQMRPLGFAQPNVQNNQNLFGLPQGFNRSNNFNQEQSYQATAQPNQNFHLNELEKIKRMNEVSMKSMQNQINMVKNELRNEMKTSIQTSLSNQLNEFNNIMASLLQMNTPSTSGLGSLPSNTIANPKGKLKAITTRSGLVTDGPAVLTPPKSITPYVGERVEETYMDPDLAEYIIKVPLRPVQKYKPPSQRNKDLGLPELIPTRMTLELANRAIYTPDGIARDVFVPVGKFTFPADFVVVNYESDPRVPLILGRLFLRTARALIDVHGEEMILRDGDERLTLNMKHDTASYSNHPHRESVNLINIFNVSSEDCLEVLVSKQSSGNPTFSLHQELTSLEVNYDIHDSEGCNLLSAKLPNIDSINDIHSHFDDNPLSKDSSLKDSIDQTDLANFDDYFVDPTPEMFTDEHGLDYLSPPIFDVYDDDFLEVESDAENVYDDPFNSKGEKIKESKLLINELDLPCDFLPYSEYDSFNS